LSGGTWNRERRGGYWGTEVGEESKLARSERK
jgi:hypothetical protein